MKEISKNRLAFSIQALILFLNSALKNKKLEPKFVEKQKVQCAQILMKLDEKELEESLDTLNKVITEMNQSLMKKHAYAYPQLNFLSSYQEMRGKILGFEHFLIAKLEEKKLPLDMQSALFKRAITLWGEIGNRVTPEEGVEEFSEIIEHTNALLADDEHYPQP